MAGERKGKTYEAIVYVVLKILQEKGTLSGNIYWNQTPKGMSIEPDFVVGHTLETPQAVFLVTHSGSAGDSHKKFWRNMGELIEVKTKLQTIPNVYNIAFDSIMKGNLKLIQACAFDGQLLIGDQEYGASIQTWVHRHLDSLPHENRAKAAEIEKRMRKKSLFSILQTLTADIGLILRESNHSTKSAWISERSRQRGIAPRAKETFVRRGLGKLLVFEDIDLAIRLYRREEVKNDELPSYIYRCGLAKKTLRRAVPTDSESMNAVSLLKTEQIEEILSSPLPMQETVLSTLRNLPHQESIGNYVQAHFSALCKSSTLFQHLRSLHRNPNALIKDAKPPNWPPKRVWLFEYIMELIKSAAPSKTSFGYGKLASEAAQYKGMPGAESKVYSVNLSGWVYRRQDSEIDDRVLKGIAKVLSRRLRLIGKDNVQRLSKVLVQQIIDHNLGNKLVSYRGFDPILHLIQQAISGQIQYIRTCFAEAANLKGSAGTTRIYLSKHTIINWQSAHGSHANDKRKELCGRAVGLRYSWDGQQQAFVPRKGVKKLFLVLDGTWRQSDINILIDAGWDDVFYPDEMNRLTKALV